MMEDDELREELDRYRNELKMSLVFGPLYDLANLSGNRITKEHRERARASIGVLITDHIYKYVKEHSVTSIPEWLSKEIKR
jgi:hypothetical protein